MEKIFLNEDENYARRRDGLLKMMKRQHWDNEVKVHAKRGRKPAEKALPVFDQTKARNKFFKYDT